MLLGNFRRQGGTPPPAPSWGCQRGSDSSKGFDTWWLAQPQAHSNLCEQEGTGWGAVWGETQERPRRRAEGGRGSRGGEGVRGSTWWERSCCSQPGRAAGRASGLRNAQQTPPERPSVLGGPGSAAGRCAALWRAVPPTLWRDSGQEEKAGWGEGGALCVTSSEKTDLDVPASFSQPTGKGVGS